MLPAAARQVATKAGFSLATAADKKLTLPFTDYGLAWCIWLEATSAS